MGNMWATKIQTGRKGVSKGDLIFWDDLTLDLGIDFYLLEKKSTCLLLSLCTPKQPEPISKNLCANLEYSLLSAMTFFSLHKKQNYDYFIKLCPLPKSGGFFWLFGAKKRRIILTNFAFSNTLINTLYSPIESSLVFSVEDELSLFKKLWNVKGRKGMEGKFKLRLLSNFGSRR